MKKNKVFKKILNIIMVTAMILSVLNVTAFSGDDFSPLSISFSTGAAGDKLAKGEGSVYYTSNGPENQCYAAYETLEGTICAALTDKSTTESAALHIPFDAASKGVVTVEVSAASSELGVDLFKVLTPDGEEAAKCRALKSGYLGLICGGDNFNVIKSDATLPINKLKTIKLTFDFDAKTVSLVCGDNSVSGKISAESISEIVFETAVSAYNTKYYVAKVMVYEGEEQETGLDNDLPTLFVIGDSTGSPYTSSDYYLNGGNYLVMRNGFGMALDRYFNTNKINIVNYAVSGISSKSFTGNANYAALKESWKEGDYLIIAFGHNDEKDSDEARFTNASMGAEGIETEGQFANSLYVNYIKPAKDVGVNVILATPIIRRSRTSDVVVGSDIHDLTEKGFGDYSQTIRDLAAKLDLPLIDNTQMTYNEYITLGKGAADGSDGYGVYQACFSDDYMRTKENVTESGELDENYRIDNTHLNAYGAKTVAYFMAQAVKGSDDVLSGKEGEEYKAVYADNSVGTLSELSSYLKSYTDPRTEDRTDETAETESLEGFAVYLATETTLHDKLGETFDVTVNVKENKGISNLNYALNYDPDILELVSPVVEGAKGSVFTEGETDSESEYADGVLAVYTFKVVGGGDTDIKLDVKYMTHNDDVYYADEDFKVGSLNIVCDFNPEEGV